MALRLEELRLLQTGTADKLKADRNRIRDRQRELGLSPIPGNSDRGAVRYSGVGARDVKDKWAGNVQIGAMRNLCVSARCIRKISAIWCATFC